MVHLTLMTVPGFMRVQSSFICVAKISCVAESTILRHPVDIFGLHLTYFVEKLQIVYVGANWVVFL